MKTLATPRLLLRPFRSDDVDFIFDMYSRPEVHRFIGRSSKPITQFSEAVARLDRYMSEGQAQGPSEIGLRAIADAGADRLHGVVLIKELPASDPDELLRPSGHLEIGWHLHPTSWGQGYATEAAQAVLDMALGLGRGRILAVTHPENHASQAVARRIGMEHLGRTHAYYNTECELFASVEGP